MVTFPEEKSCEVKLWLPFTFYTDLLVVSVKDKGCTPREMQGFLKLQVYIVEIILDCTGCVLWLGNKLYLAI